MQGLSAYTKDIGRPVLVSAFTRQRGADDLLLRVGEGGAKSDPDRVASGLSADVRRKVFRRDRRPLAQDDGALDGVAELAHISGPGVVVQGEPCLGVDPVDVLVVLLAE